MFLTDEEIKDNFKQFLVLKNLDKIPKTKCKKLAFFKEEILSNKSLFIPKGYQLCSTSLAKRYDVSTVTMAVWINKLVNIGILKYKCRSYLKGRFSRCYKFNKESHMVKYINTKNGYNDRYSNGLAKNKKIKFNREVAEVRLRDKGELLVPTIEGILKFVSRYMGCPVQCIERISEIFSEKVLNAPSDFNVERNNAWMILSAIEFSNKSNGYKKNLDYIWGSDFALKFVGEGKPLGGSDTNFSYKRDEKDKNFAGMFNSEHINNHLAYLARAMRLPFDSFVKHKVGRRIKDLRRLLNDFRIPNRERTQCIPMNSIYY